MDVFYEESSIADNSAKESRRYKIFNILSLVFLTVGCLGLLMILYIPMSQLVLWLLFCAWFFVCWFVLRKIKLRFNVSYDYTFVSGELRIARVFDLNKRRVVAKIDCNDMLQIGDADNPAFERLATAPNTKVVYCTSNTYPREDKFFMYVLTELDGRKLYVVECREEMLIHMLKFVKRSVLESDYVSQEKKKNRV